MSKINFRKETEEERAIRRESEEELRAFRPIDLDLAWQLTGVTLRSYQQEFFEATNKFRIGSWGRRTGKSTVLDAIALSESHNNRRVLMVVMSEDEAHRKRRDAQTMNTNNIIICGPRLGRARGLAVDTIIVDEYEYINSEIMEVIAPMIAQSTCNFVALSSRRGNDYLEEWKQREDSFVSSIPSTHPEIGFNIEQLTLLSDAEMEIRLEYLNY